MFTRTTIAIAMILGLSAGAFAETKKPANTSNPAFDLYDSRGDDAASDIDLAACLPTVGNELRPLPSRAGSRNGTARPLDA